MRSLSALCNNAVGYDAHKEVIFSSEINAQSSFRIVKCKECVESLPLPLGNSLTNFTRMNI
jgi:hypothetical protein